MNTSLRWVALALIALAGCHHEHHAEHSEATYPCTHPAVMDTTVYQEYVAQIRSHQHIELRTMERGYVQEIYVDEGQAVKAGQTLFQIMPVIYQAEMHRAEAEAAYAQIEYNNTRALADSNVVSRNELALAAAKLEQAKAELELAKAHLSFTRVTAPFDGMVGRFNDIRLGSMVDEGELLTTLSDNRKMWVYFNVPEAEYLDYAMSKHDDSDLVVLLQLANARMFDQRGIVETIEADFNNETGNIAFRATFENPNQVLRNGETGNILMPTQLAGALMIPQKATFEVLDKKFVYVIDAEGRAQAREIKVGIELPHLYAVTEGLSPNDRVLVDGLRKVKNGDHVAVHLEPFHSLLADLNGLHAE